MYLYYFSYYYYNLLIESPPAEVCSKKTMYHPKYSSN